MLEVDKKVLITPAEHFTFNIWRIIAKSFYSGELYNPSISREKLVSDNFDLSAQDSYRDIFARIVNALSLEMGEHQDSVSA